MYVIQGIRNGTLNHMYKLYSNAFNCSRSRKLIASFKRVLTKVHIFCMLFIYVGIKNMKMTGKLHTAVSRWPVAVAVRIQSHTGACGICGGQSDRGTDFVSQFFSIPPSVPFHQCSLFIFKAS
jgi:hypothetical protein